MATAKYSFQLDKLFPNTSTYWQNDSSNCFGISSRKSWKPLSCRKKQQSSFLGKEHSFDINNNANAMCHYHNLVFLNEQTGEVNNSFFSKYFLF